MNIHVTNRRVLQAPLARLEGELTVVITSLSLGGAERIVLEWATRLHARWSVHLIVLCNRAKEWSVPSFIRVTRLEDLEWLKKVGDLPTWQERHLAKLRLVGAIIAKKPIPVAVCHLLKQDERDALGEAGAHIVTVLHNARDGWGEEAHRLRGSSNVIAVSDACAWDLRADGWKGPVSVIRHIPARRVFHPDARETYRKAWNIPADATVFGMIGAVKTQKNYLRALKILKVLLRKRDVYLVIVGGPVNTLEGRKVWESTVRAVHEMGLRHRVAMPGFIPDAASCLPAFDAVLNTSLFEGLSIATLEALSAGKPVIASKVGGQGEIGCEALTLLPLAAPNTRWVTALNRAFHRAFEVPSWSRFPSYRLWTLAGIARPFIPTDKVLFATIELNSGGAQRSLANLAMALPKEKIEIVVSGNSTESYFYRQLKTAGVKVRRSADNFDVFTNAEALVSKICKERFGTVCFWNVDPKVKLLVVKALSHTSVRFVDVSPGGYSFKEMENVAKFGRLVSFSQEDFNLRLNALVLKYDGSYPRECAGKVSVIRNGVPEPLASKTDYRLHGAPRVAINGRIAPSKFLLEIVEAMRLVRKQIPDAQLHVFGAAEPVHRSYADKVAAAAKKKLGKDVRFYGRTFTAAECMPQFDAYVVLGKHQGCPNALLEALAAGTPSIANDDGGTREQIVHNETGLLVDGCGPVALAKAILRVIKDRRLAETIGRNGRTHVLESFSMNRMTKAYLNLFGGASAPPKALITRLPHGIRQPQPLQERLHATAA